MNMRSRQIHYIQSNYKQFDDLQLSDTLGIALMDLRNLMELSGIRRSKEDKENLQENAGNLPPLFTAQCPTPEFVRTLGWKDHAAAAACMLGVILVYFFTLPPTVTGEDAGELITAAYTLGIPHPPGYPIWTILAHIFTYIPFGTVAWRVAFMSAFFGGLTVYFLCLTIIKLSGVRWGAAAAAIAFGFSAEFWEQAVISEVYTLNNFFIILCAFLLYHWYEQRKDWVLFVFAAVYGLSLCNHQTMVMLGPIFVGFVILVEAFFWKRWRVYFACTFIALSMLSIYLYLPIRSLANPPVDWGNPETLQGFFDVISREQYSFGFEEKAVSLSGYLRQFRDFLALYVWEFTPWLAWLPFLGIYALWKRDRYAFLLVGAIAFTMSVGFILVLNFESDRQSLWLNNVFWIPAYMMGAIGIGMALQYLASLKLGNFPSRNFAWALGIAAVLSPLMLHYDRNDKSDYWFAHDFGMNILNTLEEGAIYFPTADHATFPALYLQAVEGYRPDIKIANLYGYPEESVYADMPVEMRSTFAKILNTAQEDFIENWVIQNTSTPIYFTKRKSIAGLSAGYSLYNHGLLYRIKRPEENIGVEDIWAKYHWHTTDPSESKKELSADYILTDYYVASARKYIEEGNAHAAIDAFDTAVAVGGPNKELLNNIGSLCAEVGLREQALIYLNKCLEEDESYVIAQVNLGKVYYELGLYDKALLNFEKAIHNEEKNIDAVRLSADCMAKLEWFEEAVSRYEYLIFLQPENPVPYAELGYIYFNSLDNKLKAYSFFSKSLELNPIQPELSAIMARIKEPASQMPDIPDPASIMPQLPSVDALMPNIPQLPELPL